MASQDKSIIYLSDNTLDVNIACLCRRVLLRESQGIPVISVTQEPVELGENVCVGKIGKSWVSLYRQLLAGLEAAKTRYVSIAEHDCLYTREHFDWVPPSDDVFYYNFNCWLVQWGGNHPELNGMYSYWGRRFALSQLVCARELLLASTKEVLSLLEKGLRIQKGLRWHVEFGAASKQFLKAAIAASSGQPIQLQRYLKEYMTKYRAEAFRTVNPNLDIRHGSNFTGPKRGKKRRYELPYWGRFDTVMVNY